MKATRLAIPDIVRFEPRVFGDERGFFFESFHQRVFWEAVGFSVHFVQDNHSTYSTWWISVRARRHPASGRAGYFLPKIPALDSTRIHPWFSRPVGNGGMPLQNHGSLCAGVRALHCLE